MNALLPDILSIEDLDFTPDIPCEHSQHGLGMFGHQGPAYYLIRAGVNPCGHDDRRADCYYICKGGYDDPGFIACQICGARFPKTAIWTIIGKVGS